MIFVDSSFWIATRLSRDRHHRDATELLRRAAMTPLVTSNHVRGETWTFLRRRAGHLSAMHFLDRLARTPRLRVEFVAEPLEREALDWLRDHDERGYSFVDATSFALMRSLGISEALTFDDDFTAAGFVVLRTD
jgi:predicted nucleic acid-binding protein